MNSQNEAPIVHVIRLSPENLRCGLEIKVVLDEAVHSGSTNSAARIDPTLYLNDVVPIQVELLKLLGKEPVLHSPEVAERMGMSFNDYKAKMRAAGRSKLRKIDDDLYSRNDEIFEGQMCRTYRITPRGREALRLIDKRNS